MPLKRTPPQTLINKNTRSESTQLPLSLVENVPPSSSNNLVETDIILNKSASETDISRSTPPNFASQRNKRCRVQMEVSIADQMDDFKEEMRRLMTSFFTSQAAELKNVNDLLKEIQQSNYNIENSISYLTTQNEELWQRINQLETQAKQDRIHITMLESKLEVLHTESRKSSLEIKNVPKKPNENKEDLIEMVVNLSKTVDCNISVSDIKDMYRVRPKLTDKKNSPIVVETNSTILKNKILKSAKSFNVKHKSKLCAKHLGFKIQEDTPIYLSEHLTPKGARLYFLARDLAKSKQYKFCWTAYGKVYVRENEHSRIIMIKNESQIQQLLTGQSPAPPAI